MKNIEKRFGYTALEKRFITLEQLTGAMNIQLKEEVEAGKHRLLGQILLEMEAITYSQIDDILKTLAEWRQQGLDSSNVD